MPTPQQWNQIKEMGAAAFKSGLLPSQIKSPEAAAIIGLKAYELGIPLMEGFAHIYVVNGKPTISREMMQTLVTQNISGAVIDILESTDKLARVEGRRPGRKSYIETFTIDQAKTAGLLTKDVWKNYPKAMLLNRAISALCRAYFPDGLRGCSYTAEELEPAMETTGRRLEVVEPSLTPVSETVSLRPEETESAQTEAVLTSAEPGRLTQSMVQELHDKAKANGWTGTQYLQFLKGQFQVSTTEELNQLQYLELLEVVGTLSFEAASRMLVK